MTVTRLFAYAEPWVLDRDVTYDEWSTPDEVISDAPIRLVPEDQANLVTSLCDDGLHRVAIDIDHPCELMSVTGARVLVVNVDGVAKIVDLNLVGRKSDLVPSSSENHFHLYGDRPLTWYVYSGWLNSLAEQGVIGQGYEAVSLARGFTTLRKPGVKKSAE